MPEPSPASSDQSGIRGVNSPGNSSKMAANVNSGEVPCIFNDSYRESNEDKKRKTSEFVMQPSNRQQVGNGATTLINANKMLASRSSRFKSILPSHDASSMMS